MELPHRTVVDHGTSRSGRWLRARRLRIALWIAVVEGVLVVFHVISWWIAIPVAAALMAFYVFAGRDAQNDTLKQASWVAAASQVFTVLVPILVIVVGTLALVAVGILAVIALVFLFSERR